MSSEFIGSWKLESSDKFEDFMKAVGVNMVFAKMASASKPTMRISVEDGTWHVKSETTLKTIEMHFRLNTEFDETTPDGRKVKSVVKTEGDRKIIHEQKGDVDSTMIRELVDSNTLKMTLKAKDVVATRVFKRV